MCVCVTRFAKMCIVHTSTFSTLKIHKICYVYQIDWNCSATIPLFVQKIPDLKVFPTRFYEAMKVYNRMCELRTFLQIQSHIMV